MTDLFGRRDGHTDTDDPVEAVLTVLGRGVAAVAVTLVWLLAVLVVVVVSDVGWWGILPIVCLLPAIFGVLLLSPSERLRMNVQRALPVWGDWLRHLQRSARRQGNRWLRDAGLVHDDSHSKPVNYKVYLWPDCLEIVDLPVVGVTDGRVRKAVEESLASWHAADYEIRRTGTASWHIRLYDMSRLEALRVPRVLSDLPEARGLRDRDGGHVLVRIGRTFAGDSWLDFAGVAGILLAGQPGMGKTAAVNVILSALLGRPDLADVYVIDGKGGEDLIWAKPFCKGWSNDDGFAESLDTLRHIHSLIRERLRTNRKKYGDSNGWHVVGISDMKPVLLVIDEIQTFTGPRSKEERDAQAEFIRLLMDLVKKGRSACIATVCATQKPTSDAIPTGLRDQMAKRFCFRVATPEMARAALGPIPDGEPDPTDIPFRDKGMAISVTDEGGTEYVQFDYIPETEIEKLLSPNSRKTVGKTD